MYIDLTKRRKSATGDCPYCKPKNTCPYCDKSLDPWRDPFRESQCVLNKPLMMVIPPGGVHLTCPVHSAGHHVFGTQVTCEVPMNSGCDLTYDSSKDLTYDSARPFGTVTGVGSSWGTTKFSM